MYSIRLRLASWFYVLLLTIPLTIFHLCFPNLISTPTFLFLSFNLCFTSCILTRRALARRKLLLVASVLFLTALTAVNLAESVEASYPTVYITIYVPYYYYVTVTETLYRTLTEVSRYYITNYVTRTLWNTVTEVLTKVMYGGILGPIFGPWNDVAFLTVAVGISISLYAFCRCCRWRRRPMVPMPPPTVLGLPPHLDTSVVDLRDKKEPLIPRIPEGEPEPVEPPPVKEPEPVKEPPKEAPPKEKPKPIEELPPERDVVPVQQPGSVEDFQEAGLEKPPPVEPPKICPNCHRKLPPDAIFCNKCRTQVVFPATFEDFKDFYDRKKR